MEYPLLSNLILKEELSATGPPMVEVVSWNRETDSLKFNFCWPVEYSSELYTRLSDQFTFKWIPSFDALKATYSGNYKTSDRAWYALYHYARRHDIDVIPHPIEIFHNNPNIEGNERYWKADIYMPIDM